MVPILVPFFLTLIFGLPTVLSVWPILVAEPTALKLVFVFFAPIVMAVTYLVTSGLLSKPFQKAIVPGKFPRQVSNPVYGARRMYGLCWTAVFYSGPLYYVLLTIPVFRKFMFRLFGYKGNLDFVIYPDTWIRDLPLVSLGKGSYVANKATIGTNICLLNGAILVDRVEIKDGGMVGHLTMLAPGVSIGESSEVGVGVAYGIRSKMGTHSKVNPGCVINHGVEIGNNAEVGTMSYVGIRAKIGDGIKLPGGSNIPAGAIISTKEEVQKYLSSETVGLNDIREKMSELYSARLTTKLAAVHAVQEPDEQTVS